MSHVVFGSRKMGAPGRPRSPDTRAEERALRTSTLAEHVVREGPRERVETREECTYLGGGRALHLEGVLEREPGDGERGRGAEDGALVAALEQRGQAADVIVVAVREDDRGGVAGRFGEDEIVRVAALRHAAVDQDGRFSELDAGHRAGHAVVGAEQAELAVGEGVHTLARDDVGHSASIAGSRERRKPTCPRGTRSRLSSAR